MGEENSPTVRGCRVVRPHQPGMRTHSHIHNTHRRYIPYKVLRCRKTQPTNFEISRFNCISVDIKYSVVGSNSYEQLEFCSYVILFSNTRTPLAIQMHVPWRTRIEIIYYYSSQHIPLFLSELHLSKYWKSFGTF